MQLVSIILQALPTCQSRFSVFRRIFLRAGKYRSGRPRRPSWSRSWFLPAGFGPSGAFRPHAVCLSGGRRDRAAHFDHLFKSKGRRGNDLAFSGGGLPQYADFRRDPAGTSPPVSVHTCTSARFPRWRLPGRSPGSAAQGQKPSWRN